MNLGERLRKARLEAGLSQRQLCGTVITRNMLSQIENGSACPSVDTLRYLAGALGRPLGYFLDEGPVDLGNSAVMARAREATGTGVLECLQAYKEPDPLFDRERWLLEALTCLDLAEEQLAKERLAYARSLLEQAWAAGEKTPYFTGELRHRMAVLRRKAGLDAQMPLPAAGDVALWASDALKEGKPARALAILEAFPQEGPAFQLLKGQCLQTQGNFAMAVAAYELAEPSLGPAVWPFLEECCKALKDFEKAYHYAIKLREASGSR